MRKTLVLMILFFTLVACNQGEAGSPIPTRANAVESAPRVESTATPSLPATWTPEPVTEGQHLPGAGGNSVNNNSTNQIGAEGRVTYVVQRGDTLAEIAIQYGVSLTSLAEANNITNWDVIEVGTVLVIPDS